MGGGHRDTSAIAIAESASGNVAVSDDFHIARFHGNVPAIASSRVRENTRTKWTNETLSFDQKRAAGSYVDRSASAITPAVRTNSSAICHFDIARHHGNVAAVPGTDDQCVPLLGI